MPNWTSTSIRAVAERLGVYSFRSGAGESAETVRSATLQPAQRTALARWSSGMRQVTVVIPDATRPLPAGLVSSCLDALSNVKVVIAIGIGLHRPPSDQEWRHVPHLAEARSADAEVTDTGGQHRSRVVGQHSGCRIGFNPAVVDTDGIIVVGSVELHQYAGFSGGVKAVAVGCASPETIAWIHRPALLRSPRLGVGITDDNPFRQQLSAIVQDLPPIFEVQALDRSERGWHVVTGPAESAWRAAVAASDAFYDVEVAKAAVVGVFGPKAKNLYQASRGVTQLALQISPPVVDGSPIVLVTEAPDGLGEGPGERAFANAIVRGRRALLADLASADDDDRLGGGTQRAFIVAQTSARHPVGYVALRESSRLSRFGWRYLRSAEEIFELLGTDEFLSVPDPLHRLPRKHPRPVL